MCARVRSSGFVPTTRDYQLSAQLSKPRADRCVNHHFHINLKMRKKCSVTWWRKTSGGRTGEKKSKSKPNQIWVDGEERNNKTKKMVVSMIHGVVGNLWCLCMQNGERTREGRKMLVEITVKSFHCVIDEKKIFDLKGNELTESNRGTAENSYNRQCHL